MAQGSDAVETLEGTVERVVFHNPNTGWTVLRLGTDRLLVQDTVVGNFQRIDAGERLRFTGRWCVDRKHGRQFAADTCLPLSQNTLGGIEKFLGSGLIPGIGPVMAKRLVAKFGLDALDVIERQPKRLAEVQGIGPKRASAIQTAWLEKRVVKEVMIFLESIGISPAYAHRIYKLYGNDSIRLVNENPYRLASEIHGIGFVLADRIASHLGIPHDSHYRAEAALTHVLEEMASDGNVFAGQSELVARAADLVGIGESELQRAVDRLVLMGGVYREGGDQNPAIYSPRLHHAEVSAADRLARLLVSKTENLPIDPGEAIRRAERISGIELSREQRTAFFALQSTRVMVVTGGPGTGKTTLLKGLVACLTDLGLSVSLAAPTGRAARRMAESTGCDAKTIHRLLEFTPASMRFERNAVKPLEADVIVLDEVSMVDAELFQSFVEALKPGVRLVLIGDPNQLPSVGPGTVLADLLSIGESAPNRLAIVRLDRIFRQARSSLIVTGAHDVLCGIEPRTGDRGSESDLYLVEREEPESCLDVIKELIKHRISERFGFDPVDDVQVLTPMHKGVLGAANLNHEIQELLNPVGRSLSFGRARFKVGDKVMQVRNNYDIEVFNGEIGRITQVGDETEWVDVSYVDRTARYPASELDQISLAYACSVHKSQGSEYPAVVIPLHTQHYVMLQRNLLYTAITRARKLAVIVGSKKALRIAVGNDRIQKRNYALAERVLARLS